MRVYNFPVVSTIERTKGASLFSLDVKVCMLGFPRLDNKLKLFHNAGY
jgi:hypothetical protein